MTSSFEHTLKLLASKEASFLLRGIKRGFEKESLRVDEEGKLALTPHPEDLGASLTHPFITTDYSESLLEFITPPTQDLKEPFQRLSDLHQYTYSVLRNECLWTASMPCNLPKDEDIPIAEYGNSNLGQLKHIYRRGLGKRYGRTMQTIAGIHYNFSLSESFFSEYQTWIGNQDPLKTFISEQYLGIIRNSLRYGWLLPLLFGSTPAICSSFYNPQAKIAEVLEHAGKHTLYGPYATSLRLSDLGYHNKSHNSMLVSYNSFSEYLQTMHNAVHTVDPTFAKIGIKIGDEYQQLSNAILQIEDEHYAMVRPKRVSLPEERTLVALQREGIEYIEIRALDINPFLPMGIEPKTMYFLDAFLLTCLFLDSPVIEIAEMDRIQDNQYRIVTEGRKTDLKLTTSLGKQENALILAVDFLNKMLRVAEYLDKAYEIDNFTEACRAALNTLKDLNSLPSALILQDMKKNHWSHFDFAQYWSHYHQNYFKQLPFSPDLVQSYQALAKESLQAKAALENQDTTLFPEFLAKFLAP